MRAVLVAAVAAVIAHLGPSALVAQPVVDSFETGSFNVFAPGGSVVTDVVSASAPTHALAGFRHIRLESTDDGHPATADLTAWTTVDDAMWVTFGPAGGSLSLSYDPITPVDLTAGGINDRIEASFHVAALGGTITLTLFDEFGSASFGVPSSAGAVAFPLAGYPGVDVTHVVKLEIDMAIPTTGGYHVRDIRAMRRDASALTYDVPVETIVGPPYPTPPFQFDVTDAMPSDVQAITLVNAVNVATGGAAPLAITAMDSGGDTEAGLVGAVEAAWGQPGAPYTSTAFDVRVDIAAVSGVDPSPFLPALPVITTAPAGFALTFDVHFLSDAGELLRSSRRTMLVDARPGQDLAFDDVSVSPPDPLRGDTTGFRVTYEAKKVGDVDVAAPLFEVTFQGDCVDETVVAVHDAPHVAHAQALSAWPAVTRAGTAFRLAQAVDAEGRIDLYDVSGRRIRRLLVPAGAVARDWDGRDEQGRPLAPGVTFARFVGGGVDVRTRIVHVR